MRLLYGRFGHSYLFQFSLILNLTFCFVFLKLSHSNPKPPSVSFTNIKVVHKYDGLQTPTIYVITATYPRLVQLAELTRLCHTFLHVENLHWVVVEDVSVPSAALGIFLRKCGVSFTLLSEKTPPDQVLPPGQPRWRYPRGVVQRNRGLQWLHDNLKLRLNKGVVYIADDDNTYSLRLFDEIRTTKRVSTWPVALAGRLKWEGCVTKPDHPDVIDRMQTIFKPWREFPIDMAGFAVNLDLILSHPDAKFYADPKFFGMLETNFLKNLGLKNFTELEPKADGCTKAINEPYIANHCKKILQPLKYDRDLDCFHYKATSDWDFFIMESNRHLDYRILVWHTQAKDPDIISLDKLKTSIQNTMLPCDI
ncbi:hypothetical protein ACTXT7_010782 [Hymenolepis weldensis]